MLVLFETPAGYALFKVLDEGKLTEVDDIFKQFESPDKAQPPFLKIINYFYGFQVLPLGCQLKKL
jgi:nucleolar protein 58